MDTLSWKCDEHGCQNLYPLGSAADGHVWIQGRRPYCDRGHWEWGSMGLPIDRQQLPVPSYYFMHRGNALAEAEEWMARMRGARSGAATLDSVAQQHSFTQASGAARGWAWHKESAQAIVARAVDKENPVALRITQTSALGGPVFILEVDGGLAVDGADCFPRAYMDLGRAMQETEAFLAWRLLEHAAETPGPLRDPPRPVGPLLQRVSQRARPRPGR